MAASFAASEQIPEISISRPDAWLLAPTKTVRGKTPGIFGMRAYGHVLAALALSAGMKLFTAGRRTAPLPFPPSEAPAAGQSRWRPATIARWPQP